MRLLFILIIIPVFLFLQIIAASCSNPNPEGIRDEFAAIFARDSIANPYSIKPADAPDEGCRRLRVRSIGGTLGKVFNDSNHRHLKFARVEGIIPITSPGTAWTNSTGIRKVESDSNLYIDSLTHSYAYLMPHAAELLSEIGQRFHDSLQARGGGDYRLKVTSLLRTNATVGRLRRVNRNATSESAHTYATTFDISYSKFLCDNPAATRRTFEDLKNLLAEVVFDLRAEGRCLVKRERKQACFHITAINTKNQPEVCR